MKEIKNFREHCSRLFKKNSGHQTGFMTRTEYFLWNFVLGNGQMKGYYFDRKCPVLHYTADFVCMPLRLIIETVNNEADKVELNTGRQLILGEAGFEFLQFSSHEIKMKTAEVRETIKKRIEEIEEGIRPSELQSPICLSPRARSYPPK